MNRFFVKGQESIYYTYNNGKLATDPKLACQNFINALERIPKVIESHEKEMEKVTANKDVYTNIANSSWKKEDELRSFKSKAAELDRKIALTISTNKEAKGDVEHDKSISISGLPNQIDNKQSKIHEDSEDGRSQGFRPKWRH